MRLIVACAYCVMTRCATMSMSLSAQVPVTDIAARRPPALDEYLNSADVAAVLGDIPSSPGRALLAQAHRQHYSQQQVIYNPGSAADTVFFIIEGLLKLVSYLPSGRSRIVRLHRGGSVLGLEGLCAKRYAHAAIAVTPVSAFRLPLSTLQRLRRDDPAIYLRLVERWHDYLEIADTWITEFSTGPIRGRVARLLAYLATLRHSGDGGRVQLLTCEEMGSILGVTPESVSRILAHFKRQRILARSDEREANELYRADVERLRTIGDEE